MWKAVFAFCLFVKLKSLRVDSIRTEKCVHFSAKMCSGFVLPCEKLWWVVSSSPVHLSSNILLCAQFLGLVAQSVAKLLILIYLVWCVQTVVLPRPTTPPPATLWLFCPNHAHSTYLTNHKTVVKHPWRKKCSGWICHDQAFENSSTRAEQSWRRTHFSVFRLEKEKSHLFLLPVANAAVEQAQIARHDPFQFLQRCVFEIRHLLAGLSETYFNAKLLRFFFPLNLNEKYTNWV